MFRERPARGFVLIAYPATFLCMVSVAASHRLVPAGMAWRAMLVGASAFPPYGAIPLLMIGVGLLRPGNWVCAVLGFVGCFLWGLAGVLVCGLAVT